MTKLERELLKIITENSPIYEIDILKMYGIKPGRRGDEMEMEAISNALADMEDSGNIGLDSYERWTLEANN
jgi:hypothetical protein